ncbi:MAG: response regulator transcription factor [Campylobacterales bacterium]|nr:response regulator transcription factor [Campylobacterales bacterium]
MKKTILLLEDDMALHETIVDYLQECNFEVLSAYDGSFAQELMYEKNFDLYLLDVNVPDINGFTLLHEAREAGKRTPAIFITSLNSMSDVENGYDSGCDDYIRKPFALKELKLRIDTLLKREFFHTTNDKIKIQNDTYYDTTNDTLHIAEESIQLSNKEAKLLKLFLQNQNRLVTHEEIYSALWEYDEATSDTALRTYIKNLRKYLGGEKIVSLKKLGYKFTS